MALGPPNCISMNIGFLFEVYKETIVILLREILPCGFGGVFEKHTGHAASTVLCQSPLRFVNATAGRINGSGVAVAVGGVAEIIRGL